MGDVRSIARVVLVVTLLCKSVLAAMLAVRFQASHGLSWPDVIWTGVFHAISAFNNAGFSLHGDSLMRYAGDAWVLMPIMLGIVIEGIGFPVMQDLRNRFHDPRHWSLRTSFGARKIRSNGRRRQACE